MTIYAPNIVKNGIVACWDAAGKRSYPGTGTTWTDLAGSNNGTLTNMETDGTDFSSANGGSLIFDGSDEYVDCGSSDNGLFNLTTISVCVWARPDNLSDYQQVVAKSKDDGYEDFGILTRANGTWEFQLGDQGTWRGNLSIGKWSFLVGTTNGTTQYQYEDGVLLGTDGDDSGYSASKPLGIGATKYSGSWTREWEGRIANVLIYNRALTAAEVRQNYLATRGRFSL